MQVKQLAALVLVLVTSPAMGQFERASGVIGILPLPEVFGAEPCARFDPRDIPVFRSPSSVRPFGRIHVAQRWTHHKDGGCGGLVVRVDSSAPAGNGGELPTLEFGYEQPGAIVLRRAGSWFEIALSKGTGWVQVKDVRRFLPVEQLLKDGLLHLRKGAPVPLHTRPGSPAAPRDQVTRTETDLPAKLLAFERVGGTLWLQVETLSASPCTDEKLPVAPVSGWLPFHDATGQPSVWFSSRGC